MDPNRTPRLLASVFHPLGRLDAWSGVDDPDGARTARLRDFCAARDSLRDLADAAVAALREVDESSLPTLSNDASSEPSSAENSLAVRTALDTALAAIPDGSIATLLTHLERTLSRDLAAHGTPFASIADASLWLAALGEAAGDANEVRLLELSSPRTEEACFASTPASEWGATVDALEHLRTLDQLGSDLLALLNLTEASRLERGVDRQTFLLPPSGAADQATTKWRHDAERRWLARFEGARALVIASVTVTTEELVDAPLVRKRLDEARQRARTTPFLSVLAEEGVFGPFGDPTSVDDEPVDDRKDRWPALDLFADGVGVVGDLSGLDTPVEPVGVEQTGVEPIGVAHLRITPAGRTDLTSRGSGLRLTKRWVATGLDVAARGNVAGFGTARQITLVGEVHPLCQVVAEFVRQHAAAADGSTVEVGLDIRRAGERASSAFDLAESALADAVASGAGWSSILGAKVGTVQIPALLDVGEELIELAMEEGAAMRNILQASLSLGRLDTPLATMDRLRGGIYSLAARLGVNGSSNPNGAPSSHRALTHLIREFPRMFDSGAARLPLSYAVMRSQTRQER